MRVLGWVVVLASALFLAVMGATNVLLNTRLIPRAIMGTDPDWSMNWRFAYSIWPTRLHVLDFKLTGQDPNIQLEYDQARADLTIDLPSLLHATFRATSVRGTGARFRMRERIIPGEVDPEGASVLPPIAGFPDPPLRRVGPEEMPASDAELEKELAAWFEDVDISVTELWFDGFRFQGEGEASGSFHIKPGIDVAVDGHFEVGHGGVTRGSLPVVEDLAGSAAVLVHRFDPRRLKGKDAVHAVDGRTRLWGTLEDLKSLRPLLGSGDSAPKIESAPGTIELLAEFAGGRVLPHTWLRLQSERLSLGEGPFLASGPFEARLQVEQVANAFPTGIGRLLLGPWRLEREGEPLLKIESAELAASSATLDLLDVPLADLGWSAQVVGGEAPDLGRLQSLLPATPGLVVRTGLARCDAAVWSPYSAPGRAEARLAATGVELLAGPLELRGDLLLNLGLQGDTTNATFSNFLGTDPFSARALAEGHLALRARGAPRDLTARGHPLRFAASGSLAPFVPARAGARYLLARLSARALVEAQLSGLGFLNGWSKIPPGWSFEGGQGVLTVDARVGAGRLIPGSRLEAHLEDWKIEKDALRAKGSLGLKGSVTAGPRGADLKAMLWLDPYSIESNDEPSPLVRGKRFEVIAEGSSVRLAALSRQIEISSQVQAEAPDLARFNRLLGNGGDFGVTGGIAEIDASLRSRRGGRADGQLQISGKHVGFDLSGRRLTADVQATTHLQQANFPAGAIAFNEGSVRIDGLSMEGGSQGWWSHVDLHGELVPGKGQRLRLRFGIQARDIAPLLSLYGTQLGLSGWLQPYFSMKGFEASGHLEVGNDELAIEDFKGTSRMLEVVGRFKLQGGQKWGDVVIDSGPLALGFEVRDEDTSLKWFNARGWYQGRLKEGLEEERPAPPTSSN